jgi:hypothetical protein
MAEEKSPLASFGVPDPSKINWYKAPDNAQQEYQDIQENLLSALQQRYAEPNWFKVAAGFAKPQLGGFMASLGSASEALGENVEQQRASLLPIAQVRANLALSKIGMEQNKAAADAFADWKKSNKPMDENTYTDIAGLAPNSAVASAAKAAFDAEKTNQSLRTSQNQLLSSQLDRRMLVAKEMMANQLMTREQYNNEIKNIQKLSEQLSPPIVPTGTTGNAEEPRAKDVGQGGNQGANQALPSTVTPDFLPEAGQFAEATPPAVPLSNKPDWSKIKLKPTMSTDQLINGTILTNQENKQNEQTNKKAAALEAPAEAQYAHLTKMLDPNNLPIYESAVKAIPAQYDADPKGTMDMVNLIRGNGVWAAVLNAGLKASFNGTSVSAGLPVLEGLMAKMSEPDQNKFDTLLKNLSTSAFIGAQLRGYDPEKMGAEKWASVMAQEMNASNGIKAILHQNDVTQKHIDYNKDLLANVQEGLQHPDLQKSITPFYDSYNKYPGSIAAKKLFEAKLKKITDDYFSNGGKK